MIVIGILITLTFVVLHSNKSRFLVFLEVRDRVTHSSLFESPPTYTPPGAIFSYRKFSFARRHPQVRQIDGIGHWSEELIGPNRLTLFEPVLNCFDADRLGTLGAGARTVCGLSRLPEGAQVTPCTVYSIGVTERSRFEWELNEAISGACDVHGFDGLKSLTNEWEKYSRMLHYHVHPTTSEDAPMYISQLMTKFGHTSLDVVQVNLGDKTLQYLIEDLFDDSGKALPHLSMIGQLIVRVRETNRRIAWRTYALTANLEAEGFFLFNSQTCLEDHEACLDMSFLNVNYARWQ